MQPQLKTITVTLICSQSSSSKRVTIVNTIDLTRMFEAEAVNPLIQGRQLAGLSPFKEIAINTTSLQILFPGIEFISGVVTRVKTVFHLAETTGGLQENLESLEIAVSSIKVEGCQSEDKLQQGSESDNMSVMIGKGWKIQNSSAASLADRLISLL